jgi:hypothetical protein
MWFILFSKNRLGTYLKCAEKNHEISVTIVCVPTRILTEKLLNESLAWYVGWSSRDDMIFEREKKNLKKWSYNNGALTRMKVSVSPAPPYTFINVNVWKDHHQISGTKIKLILLQVMVAIQAAQTAIMTKTMRWIPTIRLFFLNNYKICHTNILKYEISYLLYENCVL